MADIYQDLYKDLQTKETHIDLLQQKVYELNESEGAQISSNSKKAQNIVYIYGVLCKKAKVRYFYLDFMSCKKSFNKLKNVKD